MLEGRWKSSDSRILALILVLIAVMGCSAGEEGDDGMMPSPATGTTAGTGGTGTGTSGGGTGVAGGSAGMAGAMARAGTGGGTAPTGGSGGMANAGTGAAGIGMAGTGGMGTSGSGGMGAGGQGGAPPPEGGCTPAPAGSFETTSENGGPTGTYVIYRPTTLGEGGFVHPPVAWGNGLATVPSTYNETLHAVASHGFVVIANPGTGSDPQVVRQGLEWLLEQNGSGEYAGKLAVDCAGTIGYSMGGGAAIGSGSHPAVKAIVSIHGLPDAADRVSGPLLLLTSDGDTFVTKSGFVMPNYTRSNTHPTIMATHEAQASVAGFGDHLEPLGAGVLDTDPMIAWLRYWIYGDASQREWFFGADCKLCADPWTEIQRKNHEWE
jgi:hypothetical protein